jgi:predicted ATPase/class 3 adenylate cyclase
LRGDLSMGGRGTPIGYLFTDIEGSTPRWEKVPSRMKSAMARLDFILSELICRHGGTIQSRTGDGVFAEFRTGNPLQCALDIQLAVQGEDWGEVGGLLQRIGVHVGWASDDGSPDQISVNRAARIMSSGWGGQIVISDLAAEVYSLPSQCALENLGTCRLRGIEEPLKLHGLLHPKLARREFPPLRSLSIHSGTVPVATTPFFGRQQEVAEITARLETRETRIVNIIGPGGNGKSRLAAEVATRFVQQRAVHFVSLDAVTNTQQLVSAIGGALRFPFYGAASPEDQLTDYLSDKRYLLVLDNADGLCDQTAFISVLSATCASLAVLLTARAPLGFQGETAYKLSGLAVPGRRIGEVRNSPAYQLFEREARGRNPAFEIAEAEVERFVKICSFLGGSPLALRLTAQWTHILTLDAILDKLRDDLSFLDGGPGVPARQRSVHAVFAGSWGLLTPSQRKALARLSVFPNDFDSVAAEQVAAFDLTTLAALERSALLEHHGQRRLALHAIVRGFARRELSKTSADERSTVAHHSRHYLELVCALSSPSTREEQGVALDRLQHELPNIREAWDTAIRSNAFERIRRAVEPLFYFLVCRALYREAAALFGVETDNARLNCHLSGITANCLVHQGEFERAEIAAAHVLASRFATPIAEAHARQALGNIAHVRGELELARGHYESALATRVRLGDAMGRYYSMISLAALHLALGDIKSSRQDVRESFRISRDIGNTNGMMVAHIVAGDIAVQENRLADAQGSFTSSLRIEEKVRNAQVRTILLQRLGSILRANGDLSGASARHREASDLATEIGDQRLRTSTLLDLARDHAAANDGLAARDFLLEAIRLARRIGAKPLIARGVLELADIELRLGNGGRARTLARILNLSDLGDLRRPYDELIAQLGAGGDAQPSPAQADAALDDMLRDDGLGMLSL